MKIAIVLMICSILLLSACDGSTQAGISADSSTDVDVDSQSTATEGTGASADASVSASLVPTWESFADGFVQSGNFHIMYETTSPEENIDLELWMKDKQSKSVISGAVDATSYFDMETGISYACTSGSCYKSVIELSTEQKGSTSVMTSSVAGADTQIESDVYYAGKRTLLGRSTTCYTFVPKNFISTADAGAQGTIETSWKDGVLTVTSDGSTETYTVKDDMGISEQCFTAEGIALFIKVQSKSGISIMEATALDSSVSASDITVPQSVIDTAKDLGNLADISAAADASGSAAIDTSMCDSIPEEYRDQCLQGINR